MPYKESSRLPAPPAWPHGCHLALGGTCLPCRQDDMASGVRTRQGPLPCRPTGSTSRAVLVPAALGARPSDSASGTFGVCSANPTDSFCSAATELLSSHHEVSVALSKGLGVEDLPRRQKVVQGLLYPRFPHLCSGGDHSSCLKVVASEAPRCCAQSPPGIASGACLWPRGKARRGGGGGRVGDADGGGGMTVSL